MFSMDFWQDTFPKGTIGCAVLNILDTVIDRLKQLTEPNLEFIKALSRGTPDPALLPAVLESMGK